MNIQKVMKVSIVAMKHLKNRLKANTMMANSANNMFIVYTCSAFCNNSPDLTSLETMFLTEKKENHAITTAKCSINR